MIGAGRRLPAAFDTGEDGSRNRARPWHGSGESEHTLRDAMEGTGAGGVGHVDPRSLHCTMEWPVSPGFADTENLIAATGRGWESSSALNPLFRQQHPRCTTADEERTVESHASRCRIVREMSRAPDTSRRKLPAATVRILGVLITRSTWRRSEVREHRQTLCGSPACSRSSIW